MQLDSNGNVILLLSAQDVRWLAGLRVKVSSAEIDNHTPERKTFETSNNTRECGRCGGEYQMDERGGDTPCPACEFGGFYWHGPRPRGII